MPGKKSSSASIALGRVGRAGSARRGLAGVGRRNPVAFQGSALVAGLGHGPSAPAPWVAAPLRR
eukprot:7942264-Pyramimonas_sp.AAC.1